MCSSCNVSPYSSRCADQTPKQPSAEPPWVNKSRKTRRRGISHTHTNTMIAQDVSLSSEPDAISSEVLRLGLVARLEERSPSADVEPLPHDVLQAFRTATTHQPPFKTKGRRKGTYSTLPNLTSTSHATVFSTASTSAGLLSSSSPTSSSPVTSKRMLNVARALGEWISMLTRSAPESRRWAEVGNRWFVRRISRRSRREEVQSEDR